MSHEPIGPAHAEAITVDGAPVLVHGDRPLDDQSCAAIADVIRAARKAAAARPADVDLEQWRDKLASLPMSAARSWAARLLGELHAERQRAATRPVGYLAGLEYEGRWHTSDDGGHLFADRARATGHVASLNDISEGVFEPQWGLLEARSTDA